MSRTPSSTIRRSGRPDRSALWLLVLGTVMVAVLSSCADVGNADDRNPQPERTSEVASEPDQRAENERDENEADDRENERGDNERDENERDENERDENERDENERDENERGTSGTTSPTRTNGTTPSVRCRTPVV